MKLHIANANGIDKGMFAVAEGIVQNADALAAELSANPKDLADVVMAAFLRWGTDFPNRLHGTFAAAVFDMDANRLFLCRDRFGTIPLFYAEMKDGIAFGSFADEFMARGIVQRTADLQAVWDYLTLGVVPQPRTMVKDVHSIGPGELMEFELSTRKCTKRRWWRLEIEPSFTSLSYEEGRAQLREAIIESVKGVDIGKTRLLLSGGMDSAVLLAALSTQFEHVPTLTLGYEKSHQAFDESGRARRLVEHFGADAKFVTISDWDAAKSFSRFMKAMDQPSRDGFNVYLASKAAHDCGASFVATGLGGDELLESYPHLRRRLKAERISRWLRFAAPLMRRLPDRFRHNLMLPFLTRAESLESIRAQMYDDRKKEILNQELLAGATELRPWGERCRDFVDDNESLAKCISRFDVELDMEHTLLRDAYYQAEASQITPLSPLIDENVAVMAFSLPTEFKLREDRTKAIMVDAFGKELPDEVRHVPKHGFEMPLLAWLGGSLLPQAREAFASPQAAMLFKKQYCLNWSERLASLSPRDYPLWSRFILLEWMMARNITDIR